jgi:hypothetical protein
MKRLAMGVAALALLGASMGVAEAKHGGGCYPAAPVYGSWCGPTVSYRYVTEYRQVQRTYYVCQPVTTEVETTETVATPTTREVEQRYVVYETKYENVPQKRTVWRCVWEKRQQQVYVVVPRTREVEQTYYVYQPAYRKVKQQVTVLVPKTREVEREATYAVCEYQTSVEARQVTCYTPQPVVRTVTIAPCCDPCSPCPPPVTTATVCSYQMVPTTTTVNVPVVRPVYRNVVQKYKEYVTEYERQQREQEYTVCEMQRREVKQRVPVTTYETQVQTQEVTVPVMRPSEESYTVTVCRVVPRTVTQKVNVTEYSYSTRKVKRPVTTWQWVARTVTETVPVTTCVPVVTAPAGPVCMPPPSCY